MCLRPFGLYCSACLGILFMSILCMCCSHFSWYCFISFTIFSAPVLPLIHWSKKSISIWYAQQHITIDRNVAVASETISTVSHKNTKGCTKFIIKTTTCYIQYLKALLVVFLTTSSFDIVWRAQNNTGRWTQNNTGRWTQNNTGRWTQNNTGRWT